MPVLHLHDSPAPPSQRPVLVRTALQRSSLSMSSDSGTHGGLARRHWCLLVGRLVTVTTSSTAAALWNIR
jgi:hypothetical protein